MRKIFSIIISFIVFSTFSFANASEWLLEQNLDLNYWPESFELRLTTVWNYNFKNKNNQNTFTNFQYLNNALRENMIKANQEWKFSSNKINWLVREYNLFVYHTNKLFEYISIKEKKPKYSDADTAISKNYKSARSYFEKLKNIFYSKN